MERGGFHFIYCNGNEDFNENFPAHFLSPSNHVTSTVECMGEGKSHCDILYILQQTCYDFSYILNIYVGRGFTTTNEGSIEKGKRFQDRLYIVWKGANFFGTLTSASLQQLVSSLAPRPQHARLVGLPPGLEDLTLLNNVMVHLAAGSDGRAGRLKFAAATAAR